MPTLKQYGSYGFLCSIIAMQLSMSAIAGDTMGDKARRTGLDIKKSARSAKRDVKKTGRKITGQDSAWDDAKDSVKDAGKNIKDEAKYHTEKAKRHAE